MSGTATFTFADNPASDVRGVVYKADTYCVPCGVRVYLDRQGLEGHGLSYIAQEALDLLGRFNLPHGVWESGDEYQWDSDEFPKVILRHASDESTCGRCGAPIS